MKASKMMITAGAFAAALVLGNSAWAEDESAKATVKHAEQLAGIADKTIESLNKAVEGSD